MRPKRKGGIPLNKLLAAQSAGDARLDRLVERYGRDVVPASAMAPAKASTKPKRASTTSKAPKKSPNKAPGARLGRPDDSQVIETRSPRLVGYARVSTDEQTTALQLDALRAAGCAVIHEDSASGALRSRPGLDRALAEVGAGDTLVVWKLDRLGRSLRALLEVVDALRERRVLLRSLTEHIDTGTAAGKMLYSILGTVAEFERDVMRERTVAGLAAPRVGANASDVALHSRPYKGERLRSCSTAARVLPTLRAPCALRARRFIARLRPHEAHGAGLDGTEDAAADAVGTPAVDDSRCIRKYV